MIGESSVQKIVADHITWQPKRGETPVLKDICLTLCAGEFYGILGPNGAGKTSLARQILKLQKSGEGSVRFDEMDIKQIKRDVLSRQISFLPQAFRADIEFTAYDVIAMGREPHRKRFSRLSADDLCKIEEALTATSCMGFRDKPISCLSGGERQRVMIARTIAQDTPWIVLDEPVSNLDVKHQIKLMQALKRLNGQGKTVAAILHDMNLAASFCTKVILMRQGGVFAFGAPQEVLTKDNLMQVYGVEFAFLQCEGRKMPYIVPCGQC